jgi:DNA polymerase III alpha subunit
MTKTSKFGEIIFAESDIFDIVMEGHDLSKMSGMLVDSSVNIKHAVDILENVDTFVKYDQSTEHQLTTEEFDRSCQDQWHMPDHYQQMDIAKYILDLCLTDEELQRVGKELLLFQERNLFNLLRYLKYLVDVMQSNQLIWGVGRGSSVASYVLYLLKVHRVNSMYYELNPEEFLR